MPLCSGLAVCFTRIRIGRRWCQSMFLKNFFHQEVQRVGSYVSVSEKSSPLLRLFVSLKPRLKGRVLCPISKIVLFKRKSLMAHYMYSTAHIARHVRFFTDVKCIKPTRLSPYRFGTSDFYGRQTEVDKIVNKFSKSYTVVCSFVEVGSYFQSTLTSRQVESLQKSDKIAVRSCDFISLLYAQRNRYLSRRWCKVSFLDKFVLDDAIKKTNFVILLVAGPALFGATIASGILGKIAQMLQLGDILLLMLLAYATAVAVLVTLAYYVVIYSRKYPTRNGVIVYWVVLALSWVIVPIIWPGVL